MNDTLNLIYDSFREPTKLKLEQKIDSYFEDFDKSFKLANTAITKKIDVEVIENLFEFLKPDFNTHEYIILQKLFPSNQKYYKITNNITTNITLANEIIKHEFYDVKANSGSYVDFLNDLNTTFKLGERFSLVKELSNFQNQINKIIDTQNLSSKAIYLDINNTKNIYFEELSKTILFLQNKKSKLTSNKFNIPFLKFKTTPDNLSKIKELDVKILQIESYQNHYQDFEKKLNLCLANIYITNQENKLDHSFKILEESFLNNLKEDIKNNLNKHIDDVYAQIPSIVQTTIKYVRHIAIGQIKETEFNETLIQMFEDSIFLQHLNHKDIETCSNLLAQVYFSKYFKRIQSYYLKYLKKLNSSEAKILIIKFNSLYGWDDVFEFLELFKQANELYEYENQEEKLQKNIQINNSVINTLTLILNNPNLNLDNSTLLEIQDKLGNPDNENLTEFLYKVLEEVYVNALEQTNGINEINNTQEAKRLAEVENNTPIVDFTSLSENDLDILEQLKLNWNQIQIKTDFIWRNSNLEDYNEMDKFLPFKILNTGKISNKRKEHKDNKKIYLEELPTSVIQKIYLHQRELFDKYFSLSQED